MFFDIYYIDVREDDVDRAEKVIIKMLVSKTVFRED